jgi:peptidyl-prolyl cis-trans isomerase SurA
MIASRRFVVAAAAAILLPGAAALAQDTGKRPPPPRQVPAPPALGGGRLPPARPAPTPPPPVETIDDPTAALVIDGEKVSREAYGQALLQEYGDTYLENFVASWLIERRARDLKVAVPEAAVEAAVEKQRKELLEKRYRNDEHALKAALAQSGLNYDAWIEGMKRRMRRDMLAKAVTRADRDVSDAALQKDFEARYGPGGVKRVARYVFVSTQVMTSGLYTQADYEKEKPEIEADAKKRADATRAELDKGADFAALAKERSEDPMAERGGDWGRSWKNRFGADVEKVLAGLKTGDVSPVLPTPHGFLIAKATGIQQGYEFKARHILLSTTPAGPPTPEARARRIAERVSEAEAMIAAIKNGTKKFEDLATERSDDPGSKAKGGDLGTFESGKMMPEFEAACVALNDGEISKPVETPYGIHVIQLISKTRKPEKDTALMSIMLFSTEYLKVKERRLPPAALADRAKAIADDCAARLKAGEDAAALAKAHSDDMSTKDAGGLLEDPLPPIRKAQSPDLATAFEALATPGEVVVVKDVHGFHVLKLEKLDKHDFATSREEMLKEMREKEPTPAELREYRTKLRDAAKVQKTKF